MRRYDTTIPLKRGNKSGTLPVGGAAIGAKDAGMKARYVGRSSFVVVSLCRCRFDFSISLAGGPRLSPFSGIHALDS